MLATIPHRLINVGSLIEQGLGHMKRQITEAEDRIKTSGIKKEDQIINRDFVVEIMKGVEKNIVENMNLVLYN
jgi:hypothetical protein